MKKIIFAAMMIFLGCSLIFSQKTRFGQGLPKATPGADYPIKIHVYGVHIRPYCQVHAASVMPVFCITVVYADVIANNEKFELRGDSDIYRDPLHPLTVALGEYNGRSLNSTSKTDFIALGVKFDLLLAGNQVLHCTITGIAK
jgi:hypothetical protein